MKKALSLVFSAVLVCLFVFPVYAQPAGGGGGPLLPSNNDCSSFLYKNYNTSTGVQIQTRSRSCIDVPTATNIVVTATSEITQCPGGWNDLKHSAFARIENNSFSIIAFGSGDTQLISQNKAEDTVTATRFNNVRSKSGHSYCKVQGACNNSQNIDGDIETTTAFVSPFTGGGSGGW